MPPKCLHKIRTADNQDKLFPPTIHNAAWIQHRFIGHLRLHLSSAPTWGRKVVFWLLVHASSTGSDRDRWSPFHRPKAFPRVGPGAVAWTVSLDTSDRLMSYIRNGNGFPVVLLPGSVALHFLITLTIFITWIHSFFRTKLRMPSHWSTTS